MNKSLPLTIIACLFVAILSATNFSNNRSFNPPTANSSLIITGVFDGPLTGGQPKGIELYVINNIPDLSIYGVGSANNGNGTNGVEYTFPSVGATAGTFLYLTSDGPLFNQFFGFDAQFVQGGASSAVNINGDDAMELFMNGAVVDVFGEINVDGTGQPWEYLDGWAYRVNSTGPDGSIFILANWFFSGIDVFDNQTTNATTPVKFPIGTYKRTMQTGINANNDFATTNINTPVNINVIANDNIPGNNFDLLEVVAQPANGVTAINSPNIRYTPNTDYCGEDQFSYRVCFQGQCDTASVRINVICPFVYPRYTIPVVRTINASGIPDSAGIRCELQAIVHGVNTNRPNGLQFTIIDQNNVGIGVFSSNNPQSYQPTEGDDIIVRGTINHFRGLTQIAPDTIIIISRNNPTVTPRTVTTLNESTESSLVRIEALRLSDPSQWTNSGAGFNVDVTGSSGTFQMRIDNDVNIFGSSPPVGATFNLTGIGGQFGPSMAPFTGGYQILPRYQQDIDVTTALHTPKWLQEIKIAPNPAYDTITLTLTEEVRRVMIFNNQGIRKMILLKPDLQTTIDISRFQSGNYYMQFEKDGQTFSLPFEKIR